MSITRILLIDDDADDQMFFRTALEQINWQSSCSFANNGLDALRIIEEEHPQMIFLDINMPLMNGFEFLDHFRKLDKHTHVVMYTTSKSEKDVDKAEELGAQSYIIKPDSYSALKGILQEILKSEKLPSGNIRIY